MTEDGPIPAGLYEMKPTAVVANGHRVRLEVTKGEFKGRSVFASTKILLPEVVLARVEWEDTDGQTCNFISALALPDELGE